MQSLDKSGTEVTITRAASQQMMHLSLANNVEGSSPLCGTLYDNGARCINRVATAATPPSSTSDQGCGIWISHFGVTESNLLSLCQQVCQQQSCKHNQILLLLDRSNKGRMDLRAARLDPQKQQLQPITISMVEG